jgi:hypothetical protein
MTWQVYKSVMNSYLDVIVLNPSYPSIWWCISTSSNEARPWEVPVGRDMDSDLWHFAETHSSLESLLQSELFSDVVKQRLVEELTQ